MDTVLAVGLIGLSVFWPICFVLIWRNEERTRRDRWLLLRGVVGFEVASLVMTGFLIFDHAAYLVAGLLLHVLTIFSFPRRDTDTAREDVPDSPQRLDDGRS